MIITSRAFLFTFLLVSVTSLKSAALAPVNYPATIAEARRAWSADSKEITALLHRLANAVDQVVRLEGNLARDRKALDKLRADKAAALADLREGAFCTGCGRTRSDLLAHGDSFPHPGQQSRPATPEELAKAEKDFDNRMDPLRRAITRWEDELKSAQAEIMDAHHRLMVLQPVFHRHLAEEQANRLGKWLDEKQTAETELKVLRETREALATAVGQAAESDQARAARERLAQQITRRLSQAKSAEDRARQEERLFRKDVFSVLDALAAIARPIPERYGVSGPFIATNLRTPPRPIGYTVTAVYVDPATTKPSDLQQLLDGPAKPKVGGDKSIQDLLKGK